MSEEKERFVVRRVHKLAGTSYVVSVRDTQEEASTLAKAEFAAGRGAVRVTVSKHPSPEPLEVFE
jgi:hypothetical protein